MNSIHEQPEGQEENNPESQTKVAKEYKQGTITPIFFEVSQSIQSISVNDKKEENVEVQVLFENSILADAKESFATIKPLALFCFITSMSGLIFGYDVGTLGGTLALPELRSLYGNKFDSDGNIVGFRSATLGLLISISSLTAFFGGLLVSVLCPLIGIKRTVMTGVGFYLIGAVIMVSSHDQIACLFVARSFQGIMLGMVSIVSPLLIFDLSPQFIKGKLMALQQFNLTLGILFGSAMLYLSSSVLKNTQMQHKIIMIVGIFFSVVVLCLLIIVPESPQYLINHKNKKYKEARRSIAKVRGLQIDDERVDIVFNQLLEYCQPEKQFSQVVNHTKNEVKNSNNSLWSGKPCYLRRLITGILITSIQQASGINYFFFYGIIIFKDLNVKEDMNYLIILILTIINFISTLVSVSTIDKCQRKKLIFIGAVLMGILMFIFSTLGKVARGNQATAYIMIICAVGFIAIFSITWGAPPSIYISTIYPLHIKIKCIGICGGIGWLINFTLNWLTPVLADKIGFAFGYFFVVVMIFALPFIRYSVPEIKDKSIGEIDAYYEDIECKKRAKKKEQSQK